MGLECLHNSRTGCTQAVLCEVNLAPVAHSSAEYLFTGHSNLLPTWLPDYLTLKGMVGTQLQVHCSTYFRMLLLDILD